jgi:serine/threonine-protein kinase
MQLASATEATAQPTPTASPTPRAEAAPPPVPPSTEAAAPPAPSAIEAAAPPAPSATETAALQQQTSVDAAATTPPTPRKGHGLLKLNSSQNATVYVTGVPVGPSERPVEVRCGRFFVRLGEPTRDGTRWLTEGRTVRVKCGVLTEVSF